MSSTTALGRLRKELLKIQKDPPPLCSAQLKDEDDLFLWEATIKGPIDSPYERGTFKLELHFNENYPFFPPQVKFLTPIYHCNISKTGRVCLDILNHKTWSPVLTVDKLLLSIYSLLTDMNSDSPEPDRLDVSMMYDLDRKLFEKRARKWTKKYASDSDTDSDSDDSISEDNGENHLGEDDEAIFMIILQDLND